MRDSLIHSTSEYGQQQFLPWQTPCLLLLNIKDFISFSASKVHLNSSIISSILSFSPNTFQVCLQTFSHHVQSPEMGRYCRAIKQEMSPVSARENTTNLCH